MVVYASANKVYGTSIAQCKTHRDFFPPFYSRIYGTILPLIHPFTQMVYDLLSLRDMLPLWSVLTKCLFRKFSKSDKKKIFSLQFDNKI